jgi:thioredoxin-dependent peroxiredoxin
VKQGDTVEDFTLTDDSGTERSLSGLLEDGPVVLFFYPLADSSGCTREVCHFRDLAKEFAAVGAQRVGISMDSVAKQQGFASKNSAGYPLLSDPDGKVATLFGVKRRFGPLKVKRQTFVIGTDRTVLGVISSEMNMNTHADRALEVLKQS